LLLLESHIAEAHGAFQLRPHALAKVWKRERLNVHRVGTRQNRIGALMLAILIERDGAVFVEHELRAILKSFQVSGDAHSPGLISFHASSASLQNLQSERAGGVAGLGLAEQLALLRASLPHRGYGPPSATRLRRARVQEWSVAFHILGLSLQSPGVSENIQDSILYRFLLKLALSRAPTAAHLCLISCNRARGSLPKRVLDTCLHSHHAFKLAGAVSPRLSR